MLTEYEFLSVPALIFQNFFISKSFTHCEKVAGTSTGLHQGKAVFPYPHYVNISNYELGIIKNIFGVRYLVT